jgi:ATP-dependent Clp protease ATP-binding subunit ClpB
VQIWEIRMLKRKLVGISLCQVKEELDDLQDKLRPLKMKYQREKERVDELRRLKQKREELQMSLLEAERRYDLARAADLKYGALQDLEIAISKFEADSGENNMLAETVGPDQVAEVLLICRCTS